MIHSLPDASNKGEKEQNMITAVTDIQNKNYDIRTVLIYLGIYTFYRIENLALIMLLKIAKLYAQSA